MAQGFRFDNQAAIPLSQWTQPASHFNMGIAYSVHLSGVSGAVNAVPEPETYAVLLAGLGLVGAVTRRKNRKSPLAA